MNVIILREEMTKNGLKKITKLHHYLRFSSFSTTHYHLSTDGSLAEQMINCYKLKIHIHYSNDIMYIVHTHKKFI